MLVFKVCEMVCEVGWGEVWRRDGGVVRMCMRWVVEIVEGKVWVEREVEVVCGGEVERWVGEGVVGDGWRWMRVWEMGWMRGNVIG